MLLTAMLITNLVVNVLTLGFITGIILVQICHKCD